MNDSLTSINGHNVRQLPPHDDDRDPLLETPVTFLARPLGVNLAITIASKRDAAGGIQDQGVIVVSCVTEQDTIQDTRYKITLFILSGN